MSVLKSKRQAGKLEVLTKAREMCVYTVTICKNEKSFPKRNRWLLTQKIVSEAIDVMSCIRRANSVRVESRKDYEYRRAQQIEAHAHAEALLTLISIAYEVLSIEHGRVEHWTGLVCETEELLKKWMRGDSERYKCVD